MSNGNNRQTGQNRPGRSIRGPQSALTDFLASQNISAERIRQDADARRQAAAAAAAADNNNAATEEACDDEESAVARRAKQAKQKKQSEAIAKIKKSRAFKKRKRDANDFDFDDIARAIFEEKSAPLPGQMENCEICNKRFTVTPYSRAGPNGDLLCSKCAKELAKDDNDPKKKKRKMVPKPGGRRKIQSQILDGTYTIGAKSLMTLCIETLTKNIEYADSFGELPPKMVDRVARLLAKRRLVNPQNLGLFLQSDADAVNVYDGARLTSDDYIRIFQMVPKLRSFKVKNAIQFKDEVMKYLTTRHITLEKIHVHGANLLSEDCWRAYLTTKGEQLKELRIYATDKHVGDDLVASLHDLCPSLKRLKIYSNQKVTDEGVELMAKLEGLEHLGLDLRTPTSTDPYVNVINSIGASLKTLSLKRVAEVDDRLLDALHDNCRHLSKLRITDSEFMTDAGFARLFNGWENKPLRFIDFRKCRHVDASKPCENKHKTGLCSDGFRAIMKHSGRGLKELNVHACRHITKEAFEDVFSADRQYPELLKLEVSFCEEVTDFICGSIFRSCPKLKELNVFGCMKVKDVRVPRGKILVGVPNAIGMVIEGSDD